MRWASPQLHDIDALAKMVDPSLNGMYPAKSLSRFADIIALCVQVTKSSFMNTLSSKKEGADMLITNESMVMHLSFGEILVLFKK